MVEKKIGFPNGARSSAPSAKGGHKIESTLCQQLGHQPEGREKKKFFQMVPVAQLVEHSTVTRAVVGSIPIGHPFSLLVRTLQAESHGVIG
jgi:hypothetical protein